LFEKEKNKKERKRMLCKQLLRTTKSIKKIAVKEPKLKANQKKH